jgi:FKBP-type peptidyl-prolyl cis-trans isomerase FklB
MKKVKLNALMFTTLVALSAVAQPPSPTQPTTPAQQGNPFTPHPTPGMPPGLMKGNGPKEPPPEMPDKDTLSYFIGMSVGNSIKRQDLSVDIDTIAAGIRDVVSSNHTRLTDTQYATVQKQLSGALRAKQSEKRKEEMEKLEKDGAENKAKGDEFLAKNANQPGIKTFTNGIQYKVITDGTGVMPGPHDTVTVAYKGSLIDGTVFDQNDKFTTIVTGRTIKGWSYVLQQMKVGSKWQVFIPADLAYGLRSNSPKIPANSTLIFDMELISNVPAPAQTVAMGSSPGKSAMPMGAPTINATPGGPPSPAASTPVVSGQIIKVPSAEELKKGAKIEVITNAPNQ